MRKELIPYVLCNLEQMEFDRKPLAARQQLEDRLDELTEGRGIPLVIFNCLEFAWMPSEKRGYPQSVVSGDPQLSICRYNMDYIGVINLELATLGKPDLKVIIPDSELTDERVFSFAQSREERLDIALNSKTALIAELSELNSPESPVTLWSEYCQTQGLKSPSDFTAENYQRIQNDSKLQKKVRDQVKDSKKYFEKNNINLQGVNDSEIYERTSWYLAMYMGEGQALEESKAIVLNLEDGRVPAWFQRGANGLLPILNPVNPNEFYNWRRNRV